MAAEISPSVICETAFLSNIKTLPTVGRRLGGRVIAKQPGPGRLPTVSDCLAGQSYHRAGYPSFAGVASNFGYRYLHFIYIFINFLQEDVL